MNKVQAFKIFIAYEDFAEAIHAKEMSERIAFQMESVCDAWPFDLLEVVKVRERAIGEVAAADMIIVSASGLFELPDPVKRCLETGLLQRGERPFAFVLLLHEDQIIFGRPAGLANYMRQIARLENVDFFCNLGRWWEREEICDGFDFPRLGYKTRKEDALQFSASGMLVARE